MKKFWRQTHLILGLVSGLVVFISSITGALYVFKDEIESLTQTYTHVEPKSEETILPSKAFEIARDVLPNTAIHGAEFNGSEGAIEVIFYQESPLYYGAVYINPYSGEVIKNVNFLRNFFGIVLAAHTSLLLPPSIGTPIISISIIMYFILLITGIILWWPRKRNQKSTFNFSKNPKPKLLNKELHQVLGFYGSFFILIILITSSIWLFNGFEKGVYKAFGGKKEVSYSYPKSDTTKVAHLPQSISKIDSVYQIVKAEFGNDIPIEIHDVHTSDQTYLVEVNRDPSTYWQMDYIFYDQYTLKEVKPNHIYGRFENTDSADKAIRLNYDIHSGGIGGILGKLLAFLVCILSASFPITGFIMWRHRVRAKNKFKSFSKK